MALYLMCFMGGTPFGAPMIGWVAEAFGPRWGMIGGGVDLPGRRRSRSRSSSPIGAGCGPRASPSGCGWALTCLTVGGP